LVKRIQEISWSDEIQKYYDFLGLGILSEKPLPWSEFFSEI
jgi:hypothetical protein